MSASDLSILHNMLVSWVKFKEQFPMNTNARNHKWGGRGWNCDEDIARTQDCARMKTCEASSYLYIQIISDHSALLDDQMPPQELHAAKKE
jgi:hypothetical protein